MSVSTPTSMISGPPGGFLGRSTGRLVWQQFRTVRLPWLLITFLMCAAPWLVLFTAAVVEPTLKTVLGIGPLLFGLVAPAIAFSQEYEARTRSRMLMLPASWVQFFVINLICIILQTAVMFVIVWFNRSLLLTFAEIEQANHGIVGSAALHGPAISLATMLGMLAALLCRRTVIAVAAGGTVLLLAMSISAMNDLLTGPDFARAAIVAASILFCVNVLLARRWFHGGRNVSLAWEPANRSTTCPNALLGLDSNRLRTQAKRDWRALVWKETAPKSLWLLAIVALAIAMPWTPLFIALPLVTLAFGLFAFHGEQFQNRVRFLSERGISPTLIWLTKHRVWIPRTIVAIAVWPVSEWLLGRSLTPGPMASSSMLVLAIAGYAVGQLCSISFRRSILPLGGLLVACVVIGAWAVLVAGFRVPMWVPIVPLTLGMFAASWTYCRHWVEGTPGLACRSRTLAVLAISTVGSYLAVGAYRLYEVPATYVAYTDFASDINPTSSTLKEPTETATKNTEAFDRIVGQLEDDRHIFFSRLVFHRIDQTPTEWNAAHRLMKAWAEKHQHRVDAIVSIIDQGELYFTSDSTPPIHADFPVGRKRLLPAFGEHYLPLMLLEYEGSRRQAAGDFAGAEKMYAATIRGYWLTVNSDNPGRDVQTAYAAAGHIFRRLGSLGCEMESLQEPISTTHSLIHNLFRQRPALAEVHQRASDLESQAYEKATSARKQTVIWQENAPRSRKTVLSLITRHIGPSPRDWFTFGLRHQRIANLVSRSRAAELQRASNIQASFGSHLTQSEVTWALMFAEHGTGYLGHLALFDNNPARWLYAEKDLEADVAGALQLIDFARVLHAAPDKRAAAIEFSALRDDPWRQHRSDGQLRWHPNESDVAAGKDLPASEARSMFTSVGGPPDLREMHLGEGSGGRRVYPVPKSVVAKWQDAE